MSALIIFLFGGLTPERTMLTATSQTPSHALAHLSERTVERAMDTAQERGHLELKNEAAN